jgi:ribosome-associated translation inhibitor RaiA
MTTITIAGLGRAREFGARARRRLATALALLTVTPVQATIRFFDDDGPKGGAAVRCALMVQLPYRPGLRCESTATDRRSAFDMALVGLERQLDRYRARQREGRRHPKKYYVAKKLLA